MPKAGAALAQPATGPCSRQEIVAAAANERGEWTAARRKRTRAVPAARARAEQTGAIETETETCSRNKRAAAGAPRHLSLRHPVGDAIQTDSQVDCWFVTVERVLQTR